MTDRSQLRSFFWDLCWIGLPGALGGAFVWLQLSSDLDALRFLQFAGLGVVSALALFLAVTNVNRSNLTALTVFAFLAGYAPESALYRFMNGCGSSA